MTTGIDWSKKPPPWCWIGPRFAEQCRCIVAGEMPLVQPDPHPVKSRRLKPGRKHRDAEPPDPKHHQAIATRQAEVAVVKERLRIEHDLRAAGVKRLAPGQHSPSQRYFDDDERDEAAKAIVRAASRRAE